MSILNNLHEVFLHKRVATCQHKLDNPQFCHVVQNRKILFSGHLPDRFYLLRPYASFPWRFWIVTMYASLVACIGEFYCSCKWNTLPFKPISVIVVNRLISCMEITYPLAAFEEAFLLRVDRFFNLVKCFLLYLVIN